jgi:hypothetical protein
MLPKSPRKKSPRKTSPTKARAKRQVKDRGQGKKSPADDELQASLAMMIKSNVETNKQVRLVIYFVSPNPDHHEQ